ncbi:MAG TPA: hypothetical protein DDW73_21110 [Rhizobium sp.]|nr:hypothetical protein [Rhizobium sp.]
MDISIKSNFEYGKWLLASGLAVHGGALFGLNSLRDALEHDKWPALADAAKWNVGGIVFVLIAGFLAWLNFQSAVHIYHRAANPMRIYRTDTFNEDDAKTDIMSFTRWLAIAAGFLALYSVLVSAVKVFRLLDTI